MRVGSVLFALLLCCVRAAAVSCAGAFNILHDDTPWQEQPRSQSCETEKYFVAFQRNWLSVEQDILISTMLDLRHGANAGTLHAYSVPWLVQRHCSALIFKRGIIIVWAITVSIGWLSNET